jgi:molecular chaperone DnaK
VFSTASDGQTVVFVRVAQGESDRFTENAFLGELELSGLTPAPRGELEIVVIFEIDADGILNVRAQDGKTGRETRARLHAFGAQHEEHELAAMQERQARHTVE